MCCTSGGNSHANRQIKVKNPNLETIFGSVDGPKIKNEVMSFVLLFDALQNVFKALKRLHT